MPFSITVKGLKLLWRIIVPSKEIKYTCMQYNPFKVSVTPYLFHEDSEGSHVGLIVKSGVVHRLYLVMRLLLVSLRPVKEVLVRRTNMTTVMQSISETISLFFFFTLETNAQSRDLQNAALCSGVDPYMLAKKSSMK